MDDEKMNVCLTDFQDDMPKTHGDARRLMIVSESGLYTLSKSVI